MPLTVGRFGADDPDREPRFKLSVLEQLDVFRKRLIRSAIGVGVGVVVAFAWINPIVDFVFKPIRSILPPGSKLIYTVPGEAFSVYVTIALIAGLVLASPYIMWNVWQMIAPALYLKEKKFAFWFILMTTVGFVGGAAFNHYIAFKMLMVFFAQFNSTNLTFLPRLDDVLDMYTRMLLVMGIVFQMPTLVFFPGEDGAGDGALSRVAVQVRDPRDLHHRGRGHAERRSLQPDDSRAADDRPLHHQHLHRVDLRSGREEERRGLND